MKKKIISAMLTATMVASLLAGCGSKASGETVATGESTESDGTYKEFITVDVYDEFANYQGLQTGWFAKIVKDRFNMELNIIAPNVAGGGQTLFQTRSAAGDLGDLILIDTANGKLNDLVESELVIDTTDMIKDKDVYKNFGGAIDALNATVPTQGMWAFPNSVSSEAATEASEGLEPTFGPYIRWDYYKELGYPKMASMDDFLDVLEDMQALAREKEGATDIYAISLFKDWDGNLMNNAKQLACMYGFDELGFVLAKADGSAYESILDSESIYNKVLKFFYEANQRGLVDPDSTSQNYDTLSTKYMNGKILYCPWPWLAQNQYNTTENKEAGKGYMMATFEDMQIFSYGNSPEGNSARAICIGSNAEDPQRLADFIDWLYSPEGILYNGQSNGSAGPEGLTWEKDTDGNPVLTEFGKSALPSNDVTVPDEWGGGSWKEGISTLNFKTVNLGDTDPEINQPYDYTLWPSVIEDNKTPLAEDWSAQTGAESTMEYLENNNMIIVAPGTSYTTPAEESSITTIRGQVKATIVENSWKMIFAANVSEFETTLKTMQETANGLGYEDVYAVDLANAKDQQALREEFAAKYPSAE